MLRSLRAWAWRRGGECACACGRGRGRRALGGGAALCLLAATLWLALTLAQRLHPDRYLAASPRLAALALPALSWLDLTDGRYFRPRAREVSPLPHLLAGPAPARPCRPAAYLVALVPSPPHDAASRRLIRRTWGRALATARWPGLPGPLAASGDVFFVLGTATAAGGGGTGTGTDAPAAPEDALVAAEARRYGDLIVGDFLDSYRNLTRKTLLGLSWASRHCAATRFVVKVDQDTLVDFPRLLDFLLRHEPRLRHAVVGKLYFDSRRLSAGKWRVGPEEYPFSRYPTFAGGPCYLLSTAAVAGLVNVSRFLPPLAMEDVQVTGVLARAAGVPRLHMEQLRNWYRGESYCVFLARDRYQVSLTELSRDQLRHVWDVLSSGVCRPYRDRGN